MTRKEIYKPFRFHEQMSRKTLSANPKSYIEELFTEVNFRIGELRCCIYHDVLWTIKKIKLIKL